MNGKEYKLSTNNGENSLHGGPTGFHARHWNMKQTSPSRVEFTLISEDGEEGFPGRVEIMAVCTLISDSVEIELSATLIDSS